MHRDPDTTERPARAVLAATLIALMTVAACSDVPTRPAPPAAAHVAVLSGSGQYVQVGGTLRMPLVVRVTDDRSAAVAGVVVAWSAEAGALSSPASVTDAGGRASVEWTLGEDTGRFTTYATVAGLPSVSFTATAARFPRASAVDTLALVLEYASVYDVHEAPDPMRYPNIRAQRDGFHVDSIRRHLEAVVDPSGYDFVLLYTLHEVPGWIYSGTMERIAAKNIGFWNRLAGQPGRAPWTKLRAMPHMNSLRFIVAPEHSNDPHFGPRTALHEMGHAWLAYFTGHTITPESWRRDEHAVAYLASGFGHWHTTWVDDDLPGRMATKPTSGRFNAFDLYALGLMGYEEARLYRYRLAEQSAQRVTSPVIHEITLDSLIQTLRPVGDTRTEYFEGDGRRIPDVDPDMAELEVLLVVVKGADETFTEQDRALVTGLAHQISHGWKVATWGRSSMRVVVRSR